jgi:hypothetical protein
MLLACLVAGVCGGLLRAGVLISPLANAPWLGAAVQFHSFLMISAFMGSVIAVERAVAAKVLSAWLAPALSASSGLCLLAGVDVSVAAALACAASVGFVSTNLLIVFRQPAPHTRLLLVGACAWFIGNLGFAASDSAHASVPWWFAFLVLTIAAERLEMTRLMRRRPGASWLMHGIVGALLAGCALFAVSLVAGGIVYGLALLALAAWLLRFDIARRTVFAEGLSRYMAVCLLAGYFWLAIAGICWIATSLGLPLMDAAIHALALGFVFSMMLGHAPVILPAIAGVNVRYSSAFYLPLVLLHTSLAVRILMRHTAFDAALSIGAIGNALAILLFAGTLAGSAIAWHKRPRPPRLEGKHS